MPGVCVYSRVRPMRQGCCRVCNQYRGALKLTATCLCKQASLEQALCLVVDDGFDPLSQDQKHLRLRAIFYKPQSRDEHHVLSHDLMSECQRHRVVGSVKNPGHGCAAVSLPLPIHTCAERHTQRTQRRARLTRLHGPSTSLRWPIADIVPGAGGRSQRRLCGRDCTTHAALAPPPRLKHRHATGGASCAAR